MPTKAALKDSFLAEKSDDELVELARRTGNDDGAFEELYRRHENAARNVARHIVRSRHDADDVVNEAFAGVISAINHGAGPRSNFRQYLMACVRNSCKSRRWCGRSISTDPSLLERSGAIFEDPERLSEAGLVANAFSSLSPDWQQTLWLTAVEERPAAEVAEQLGRRPAAVAALAHRAREAFAEAYLAQHQARTTDPTCARISPKLAHYVRGRSGDVESVLVERHLVECVACSCAVDELRDLNASLRTLTGPAPLVGVGAAAAVGAATMVGFLPIVGASGWSVGAVSGAALAKVAVLGALLIPAAIVAAKSTSAPDKHNTISTAAAAAARSSVLDQTSVAPSAVPTVAQTAAGVDPLLADVVSAATTAASAAGTTDPATTATTVAATTAPAESSTSNTSPLPLPNVSVPVTVPGHVSVTIPPVAGGGGTVNGGVTPSGGSISVSVTVPVVTLPINVNVSIPPISTPPVYVPSVSIPVVSTPVISTPVIEIPSVTVPDLGIPVPPVSTPPITIPSVTIPSVTIPSVSLPAVSIPSVTLPPILPTISIPSILGGLDLPTISIPRILGP